MTDAAPATRQIGLGVVGLGRAFTLMLPALRADPRFALIAAADPRAQARARFVAEFGGRTYHDATALSADPAVEAVYVATPHQCHAADVLAVAGAGRHVLVEKPMALDLAEAEAMCAAARRAGVQLIVGPSHSFDPPVVLARSLISSGRYGRLRMIHIATYTDFLYRPRRPEELDTAQGGGGAVLNQAAHQVDVVRLLGGGLLRSVRAFCGAWDPARPTEGAYATLLAFADGAFASLAYSGYAHYDTDALHGWIGEDGRRRDSAAYGTSRARLAAAGPTGEAALRTARGYGGPGPTDPPPEAHPQFGLLIAGCEHADLVPTPYGVEIHGDGERNFLAAPDPAPPRRGVLDSLYTAVTQGVAPVQDGAWGMASLEACLAILTSAREGREITLARQIAV